MKTTLLWITVIVLLVLAGGVLADATGYDVVTTPPVEGMLALGTAFTAEIMNAGTGQMQGRAARIEAYVIWNQPIRPPGYIVYLRDGCACEWFIWDRATIDAQINK